MKKIAVFLLILLLIFNLAACSDKQAKDYDAHLPQASRSDESELEENPTPKNLSGKLKISFQLKSDSMGIYPLIEQFQKEYPEVEVESNYQWSSEDSRSLDYQDIAADKNAFMTRLFTEISSGEAPDVLFGVNYQG